MKMPRWAPASIIGADPIPQFQPRYMCMVVTLTARRKAVALSPVPTGLHRCTQRYTRAVLSTVVGGMVLTC